ncbi:hypothetical protein ACM614_29045 [Streptomyces sp. 12297]
MEHGSRKRYGAGAALLLALMLGATGCGGGGDDTDAKAAAAAKSAEATGPFGQAQVKAALAAAVERAGTSEGKWTMPRPPAAAGKQVEPDLLECGMTYHTLGSETEPVTADDAVTAVEALEARGWKQGRKPEVRKYKDGRVDSTRHVLKKRGWTTVAEYRQYDPDGDELGSLKLGGMDDACIDKVRATWDE